MTTTTGPLVWADDTEDRDLASDGHSRYGAYLRQRRGWFDFDDMSAAEFTAVCWQIATSPVMTPGYLRHRPDLDTIEATHTDGQLVMCLRVPLLHYALAGTAALRRLRAGDWNSRWDWDSNTSTYQAPAPGSRPAVMASAVILLPVPAEQLGIPAVTADPGTDLTRWAKDSVRAAAAYTTTHAAPLIEALHTQDPR